MRNNLIADLFIRAFGLVRLFITPLILNTTEYGEMGLMSAIFLYANFADLGLQIHYEVMSTMDPAHIQNELKVLFKQLIPRLFLSGIVLSIILYLQFSSIMLSLWCFIYVFTMNIDTLYMIIMRQQKSYNRLALSTLLQAIFLTILVAPLAFWFRAPGVIALQALVPIISIIIGIKTVNHLVKTNAAARNIIVEEQHFNNHMTIYLFMGQILMMVWITADRFFLSKTIIMSELGLWNLGNMAGSILIGYANTWATLKFPLWKRENHKVLDKKFILSLMGIYTAGVIGLILATSYILKKYLPGIKWNILWLTTTFFVCFIFIFDTFARSQMQDNKDAKKWLIQKFVAILVGSIASSLLYYMRIDPRLALICGTFLSALVIYFFTFNRVHFYNRTNYVK